MDALAHQVAERGGHRTLALEAVETSEGLLFDFHREMALAAAVVAGMAPVLGAVVDHREPGRSEGGGQALGDFPGDGAG